MVTAAQVKPGSQVKVGESTLRAADFSVLGFSAAGKAQGPLVLAGYGVVSAEHHLDDYAGLEVKGKIVLVRRFAPEGQRLPDDASRRRLGDLRHKAWLARERGAAALVVVDWPLAPAPAPADWKAPAEAPLLVPSPTGAGDAGLPVVMVKRAALEPVMRLLRTKKPVSAALDVGLVFKETDAFNVVGRIAAGKTGPAQGTIVLGAHYDHLGLGTATRWRRDSASPTWAQMTTPPAPPPCSSWRGLWPRAGPSLARCGDRLLLRRGVGAARLCLLRARPGGRAEERARHAQPGHGGSTAGKPAEILGSDSAAEWSSLAGPHARTCAWSAPSPPAAGSQRSGLVLRRGGSRCCALRVARRLPQAERHRGQDQCRRCRGHRPSHRAPGGGAGRRPRLTYQAGKGSTARRYSFQYLLGHHPRLREAPRWQAGVLLAGVRPGGAADRAGCGGATSWSVWGSTPSAAWKKSCTPSTPSSRARP